MKNKFLFIIGICLFIVAQESSATDNIVAKVDQNKISYTESIYSPAYQKCMKLSPNPNECIEKELKLQDKKLNTAYKQAKNKIQPFRVKSLQTVQRIWILYRDKKCNFFYHKESGSSGLTDALECKLHETVIRTKELNEIY